MFHGSVRRRTSGSRKISFLHGALRSFHGRIHGNPATTRRQPTMTLAVKLNRRHKTALFLTVLAAGFSLLLPEVSAKQTAGILLLGLAFAWVFGSDSRPVHWLFVVLGMALFIGPVGFDWYSAHDTAMAYARRVAVFERKLPKLAELYPLLDLRDPSQPPTPGPSWVTRQELARLIKGSLPDMMVS